MFAKMGAILDHLLILIRYLYLLRFSLALWLFALALVGLNLLDQTLTSGILAPEFPQAYLCIAFFLVSSGFAALISARVTLINGPERLDECPDPPKDPPKDPPQEALSPQELPELKLPEQKPPEKKKPEKNPLPFIFKLLLVNDDGEWEWVPVILSLLPTILVGIYFTSYGSSQGVNKADIILGFLGGMLLAGIVWYVVNLTYYITYDASEKPWLRPEEASLSLENKTKVELGVNAARTILYPRRLFSGLTTPKDPFTRNKIEGAETILKKPGLDQLGDWFGAAIITVAGKKGYADPETGKLYEAQIFAIIAMFVFLGLYLMIWPMAAPVPSLYFSIAALAVLFAFSVFATVIFLTSLPSLGKPLKIFPTVFVWLFFLLVCWFYLCTSAERFPIFATVLILAISLFWALAGIAFYVDRFRVPVFTVLLLLVIIPRLPFLHLIGGLEEHYFSTVSVDKSQAAPVPTPAEILETKLHDLGSEQPLIIVTATGGGLHASAWTAAVLAQLENEFATADTSGPGAERFNKHLLLASTVSGGSVGLDAYLRYLHDAPPLGTATLEQMQTTAQCSSLEAVGWGLVYYDLPKAFIPGAPYVAHPSSGDGDLDSYGTPLFKDRTWALRKGFERNQANTYCDDLWKFDQKYDASLKNGGGPKSHLRFDVGSMFRFVLKMNRHDEQANKVAAHQLTLRSFPAASENGPPAFSMNTTSVEEGSRFLLANYQMPHYPLDVNSIYPAQSFLSTFGSCSSKAPDLPLSTAAQLSATFPYVSSAARVPKSLDCHSVHFVDGGYYDNDGTASALEFLRYALASPDWLASTVAEMEKQDKAAQGKSGQAKPEQRKPGQAEIPPCDPNANPYGDQNVQNLCGELSHLKSVADKIKQQKHPVRIVWIEIRNSGDFDGGVQQTGGGNGADPTDSNLLGQLGDVPLAFWQGGHESVTARNRVALGLTEKAIPCEVQIHRIIIADSNSRAKIKTDPLNWSLTPIQRNEVRTSADNVKGSSMEAKSWFYKSHDDWDQAQAVNDTPCVASAQVDSAASKK